MRREIKVLPGTVRVENIDLIEFMKDLSEILKNVPELEGVRANGVNLVSPRGNVSMSWVTKEAFNMTGSNPEILEKLIEAMKKYYQIKAQ